METIKGHKIKVYVNKDVSDKYTVVYIDRQGGGRNDLHECLVMTDNPLSPSGICQHSDCLDGRHLGTLIKLRELPEDCRLAVIQDLS